jgi:hypothetical protein
VSNDLDAFTGIAIGIVVSVAVYAVVWLVWG